MNATEAEKLSKLQKNLNDLINDREKITAEIIKLQEEIIKSFNIPITDEIINQAQTNATCELITNELINNEIIKIILNSDK